MTNPAGQTDQERYFGARRDPDRAVLEGLHAIKHAIRFGAIIEDIVTDARADVLDLARSLAPDIVDTLASTGMRTGAIDDLTPTPPPTRVLAIARRPPFDADAVFASAVGHIVLLDQPRHLGNIGAAVRVCAAAGAAALITTGTADPWHPAALRGGAGLQFALPVGRIDALPPSSRAIVALDPEGAELDETAIPPDAILVFGSERSGITAGALARSDLRVRIPMRDGVSSLNLATAVAAMLYGARRRA